MTDRTIQVDGLPAKYDPAQLAVTLRQSFDQVAVHLSDIQDPAAPPATPERYPSFKNSKRVALAGAGSAGVYGTVTDPRVAYPTTYEGSGLSDDGQAQRFRFDTGTAIYPLLRFPIRNDMWIQTQPPPLTVFSPALGKVAFGLLVPGILHDLRRPPERVTFRGSAGGQGPTGQLLQTNGDATYYPVRTNMRADMDFIPIFGRTADDIEFRLKHLVSFSGGLFGQDDQGGTQPGMSSYENPGILRQIAADMVTTGDRFGGILVATHWGLGTFASSVDISDAVGNAAGREAPCAWLRNSVNDVDDSMTTCSLPELGKSLFGLPILSAPLLTYLATGLRLALAQGTVDFVLE